MANLNSAHQAKKQCNFDSGQIEQQQLLLNYVNLRDFLGAATKLKKSIFKNNNQIKYTVTTRTWFCQKNEPERGQLQGLYPDEKMVGPRFFEWQMLFFRVQGYCIILTKMKATSLCLFQFFEDIVNTIFLKYSQEGRLSLSHVGIQNCYRHCVGGSV